MYPKASGIRRQLVSEIARAASVTACFHAVDINFMLDIKIDFALCFSVYMGNQEADFRKNIEDWAFQVLTNLV